MIDGNGELNKEETTHCLKVLDTLSEGLNGLGLGLSDVGL